jgi:class 3 adenylate cyclase
MGAATSQSASVDERRGLALGCGVAPPVPPDEGPRLDALRALQILDTPGEQRFDRLTQLVARLFDVPIAYVSMVDENRQWFKSKIGLEVRETPRAVSFCGHAILQDEPLVIPDTLLDPRFAGNPHVTGDPFVRFYGGHQLRSPDGYKVGTLCMMDAKPRAFDPVQRELFSELAALVERELALTERIGLQHEVLRIKEELIESQQDLARLYAELEVERQKSEDLLLNILPEPVAEELKRNGSVVAVRHPCASVMFTDFVSFTRVSEALSPEALVADLHECFSAFDRIVAQHNVEKLKTIGDGYMCVAGIPAPYPQHAHDLVRAALEIRDFVEEWRITRQARGLASWQVRIGIHSGPIVAGVVGLNKFAYDVWGDAVNVAARLEAAGQPGRVHISQSTYELVQDAFACEPRGLTLLKNHAPVQTYFAETAR